MCLVFKTTCRDREKPLREGTFSFTRMPLFPPLDNRNTRDNAKGLRTTSEKHIGELDVRCLSRINRGQDSMQRYHFVKICYIGLLAGGIKAPSSES